MDLLSYAKSSAMSRAHFALIRSLEAAKSDNETHTIIYEELRHIYTRLNRSSLSPDKVQKYIIIALFCHTVNPIPLDKDDFIGSLEFLKPWAVKLTARQHSVDQRNLAYIACRRLFQRGDQFTMMLINTYHEDLRSNDNRTVIMALDSIRDLLPADSAYLFYDHFLTLLSDPREDVLLHTLTALKVLAPLLHVTENTTALSPNNGFIHLTVSRTKDLLYRSKETSIISATISLLHVYVSLEYVNVSDATLLILHKVQAKDSGPPDEYAEAHRFRQMILYKLRSLPNIDKLDSEVKVQVLEYAVRCIKLNLSESKIRFSLVLEALKLLPVLKPERVQDFPTTPLIQAIKELLETKDENLRWIVLQLLISMDPQLWTNKTDIFGPQEWKKIMKLLHSDDYMLRKHTILLLKNVDKSLSTQHTSHLIESLDDVKLRGKRRNIILARALEALELSCNNGEEYFKGIILISRSHHPDQPENLLEPMIIEVFLNFFCRCKLEFQLEVVKTLCAFVIEQRRALNCTLVVLASSVLCETATMDLGCSKKSLVDAFVEILPVAPDAIEELVVLIIIRLTGELDEMPLSAINAFMTKLEKCENECDQVLDFFLSLRDKPRDISLIAATASSQRLPDFSQALLMEIRTLNIHNPPQSGRDILAWGHDRPVSDDGSPLWKRSDSQFLLDTNEPDMYGLHRNQNDDGDGSDESSEISSYFPRAQQQDQVNDNNYSNLSPTSEHPHEDNIPHESLDMLTLNTAAGAPNNRTL